MRRRGSNSAWLRCRPDVHRRTGRARAYRQHPRSAHVARRRGAARYDAGEHRAVHLDFGACGKGYQHSRCRTTGINRVGRPGRYGERNWHCTYVKRIVLRVGAESTALGSRPVRDRAGPARAVLQFLLRAPRCWTSCHDEREVPRSVLRRITRSRRYPPAMRPHSRTTDGYHTRQAESQRYPCAVRLPRYAAC